MIISWRADQLIWSCASFANTINLGQSTQKGIEMIYRIRRMYGEWVVNMYDHPTDPIDKPVEIAGPFDTIEIAQGYADTTGYADADRG